jgi:hypothetical protein
MLDFITRRFSLQSARTDGLTWFCVAVVWLLVLGCTISSICRQFQTKQERVRWILIVTCLPVLGLLWYLPFSFKKEDFSLFFGGK